MNVREPADQLGYFQKRQKEIVETIRQLVELESPSDVKQSVDRVGTVLASRFSELGGKIKFHPAEKFGKHLQIDFRPRGNKIKPVLLLGPMDTVTTARKAVGDYTLQVAGVAAHSGLDFEKGQNAVIELAHQVLEISKLVDPKSSVTLNVGKISGGTRVNVVPATATATIDVRV